MWNAIQNKSNIERIIKQIIKDKKHALKLLEKIKDIDGIRKKLTEKAQIQTEQKKRLEEEFIDILSNIADELLGQSHNAIKRYKQMYINGLKESLHSYSGLENSGTIRIIYDRTTKELEPGYPTKPWDFSSSIERGKTILQHWKTIKHKYNPEAREIMDKLGY